MDLKSCLADINKNRDKAECPFVFCLWKEPDLFDDYKNINSGTDTTIQSEDGLFYFELGRAMKQKGYRNFDNMSIYSFLEDKPSVKEQFENYGGYRQVQELISLVDSNNVEAYYDTIARMNTLDLLCKRNFEIFGDIQSLNRLTSQGVYDLFEYALNTISLSTNHDVKIEDLVIDDGFIEECMKGEAVGLNYGKACPILNHLTLGLPLGELTMVGGHSGTGKTSFIFENMILPLNNEGHKTAIISNEMRSTAYKALLLEHILVHDLKYKGLTRKQIKIGKFTEEQLELIKKAQKISREKYSNIRFVKLFDTDVTKVLKFIKRLSKLGYQAFCWDTMKSDDSVDEVLWQQLMINSRKIFQLASKENIAIVTTYQLALHTTNHRFLDASCLSNSKQIKEVYSEMIYFRTIWEDEFTGGKFDCKPYQFKKDSNGKYTKIKEFVPLNPDSKYVVAFLDKTRNDEDKQQVLYEWIGRFNEWKEVGFCSITNDHRY